VPIGSTPRRVRARAVSGEAEADKLRGELEPFVKADDAAGAEALLLARAPLLSLQARAEFGQRVAWIYYTTGQDAEARRVADQWRQGASGAWVTEAEWVSALASWRLGDCDPAARAFAEVGRSAGEPSLSAAGHYWAARAEMLCRRPASVQPLLRAAARHGETFYGLLARRALGMETRMAPVDPGPAARVAALPNVVRAEALVRMGERDLAGELLRHQARIGTPADQPALVAVASRLELAATQHFLGHFGQPGSRVPAAARYPRPSWTPRGGWKIDPALALAHALQESSFRTEAVSPAGAVGLMQVLPSTRDLIVRARAIPGGNLKDPAVNMQFGQEWIRWMRTHPATSGRLPKIIASYNAGPLPVGRWAVNDRGDPLLWIESMPFWETRFYVPTVLRNLWVYQSFDRAPTPTLTELAQHRWPSFPEAR
jgi:soluble lytic murein transglycosylase